MKPSISKFIALTTLQLLGFAMLARADYGVESRRPLSDPQKAKIENGAVGTWRATISTNQYFLHAGTGNIVGKSDWMPDSFYRIIAAHSMGQQLHLHSSEARQTDLARKKRRSLATVTKSVLGNAVFNSDKMFSRFGQACQANPQNGTCIRAKTGEKSPAMNPLNAKRQEGNFLSALVKP